MDPIQAQEETETANDELEEDTGQTTERNRLNKISSRIEFPNVDQLIQFSVMLKQLTVS